MCPSILKNRNCDKHCGVPSPQCRLNETEMITVCRTALNIRKQSTSKGHQSSFHYVIGYFIVFLMYLPLCCESFCPPKCLCEYESLKVQCTNASLEFIPFLLSPQIQTLSLPCNKIEGVGQSLAFYPDLKKVDLSYNNIESIDVKDFEAQQNLLILNLNKNKLKSIQNKSFVPLTELRELYLSYNNITLIEPNSFDSSNALKVLDLSNNKLSSFRDNTFSDTNTIETLKLGFNFLHIVPSNALSKIQSLQSLDLTGNLISEVPKNAFQFLANLSSIVLDKNIIRAIYPESFEGLRQLKSLSLKDNRLNIVTESFFRPLTNLHSLDLSGNLFQELEKEAFPDLPSLLHLRLSRCPRLIRIDSDAFVNLVALETLQLSHNARLVYLGDSTFSSLDKLIDLDLTACGLNYVHPKQMPRNKESKLHLAGNPFHCNCSLMWLASLPVNDSFYLEAPTCATPPNLYGIAVAKVDLRIAGCEHPLGLAAIGTCVGVVLLGLLVIAVFLAWRWSRRTLTTNKTLPGASDRGIREPWGSLPPPPPGPMSFQDLPMYAPKYCVPSQLSVPSCGHVQCQGTCGGTMQPPYSLHQVTRPLLTPPSPSINNHSQIPVGWLYPSPYDEDTHWYTTIGRDGREYLTGELKRDHSTPPPPLPKESPPPHPVVPSHSSPRLKRGPSSASMSQRTPILSNRPSPAIVLEDGAASLSDRHRIPVTYI